MPHLPRIECPDRRNVGAKYLSFIDSIAVPCSEAPLSHEYANAETIHIFSMTFLRQRGCGDECDIMMGLDEEVVGRCMPSESACAPPSPGP